MLIKAIMYGPAMGRTPLPRIHISSTSLITLPRFVLKSVPVYLFA